MQFHASVTADKASLADALAIEEKLGGKLPAPVADLLTLILNALPAGWQADIEVSGNLSLDFAATPSALALSVTPKRD